jgi:transcriptional regulator with XRE-family HTH domain
MEKEKIDKLIKRIAATRVKKGFSYENMANELDITPAAYRKIEIGKTKLTVERLFQISQNYVASLKDEITHLKSEMEFLRGLIRKQE